MTANCNKTKSISSLCHIIDCEHKTAPYIESSKFLVVRTSNVRNGKLIFKDIKYTTREGFEEWTQRAIPEYGDVLFSREAPAGEACLVPENINICMGQRMVLLRPKLETVNPVYLALYLATERCKYDIYRLSIGSTVLRINIADIRKLGVLCPSLSEQTKIAQILSTWDKTIDTTEKLIENSKAQKRALMQQLLTGRKGLPGFSRELKRKRLNEITRIYDGTHTTPTYVEKGVPFYSVEHLTKDDFSNTKFVSEEVFKNENKRVKLERGDILMTRIGDIGTSKYLSWDVKASFYVSLALIKNSAEFNSQYLSYYINSEAFQRELWKRTIHVAFPKKINLGEIGNCLVSLPPQETQEKIAVVLSIADREINYLQQSLGNLKLEKKALMQQLLTGKRRVKLTNN